MTTESTPRLGGPNVQRDGASADFFDATRWNILLIKACRSCSHLVPATAASCSECCSTDLVARQARGSGRLVSWAVVHVAPHPALANDVPFVTGIVELLEGPWLRARIMCEPSAVLQVGTPLEVSFVHRADSESMPVFNIVT
jgi:uncharacterized OB-fold protein